MAAVRRYVLPLLWLLVLGVIALALVKMAFFPFGADAAGEDGIVPGAELDDYALVTAESGDITASLALSGMVEADEGTPLTARTGGEITKIWKGAGQSVDKGEKVLQVRYEVEAEPALVEAPAEETAEGAATAPQPAPQPAAAEYRYVNLVAPESGILTDMTVKEWEDLAEGAQIATISPGTYSIRADLTPEQQLSLLDQELKATAAVPTTEEPVPCTAPQIDQRSGRLAESAPQSAESENPDFAEEAPAQTGSSGEALAHLLCPVPEGVRVVPGLAVDVTVDLGTRSGVLIVPTTAVEGKGTSGTVYVLDEASGEPAPVEVGLGLRQDGQVEITSGLEAGQEILQFVPGVDAPADTEEIVW